MHMRAVIEEAEFEMARLIECLNDITVPLPPATTDGRVKEASPPPYGCAVGLQIASATERIGTLISRMNALRQSLDLS